MKGYPKQYRKLPFLSQATKWFLSIAFFLLISIPKPSFTQNSDVGFWYRYFGVFEFQPKWILWTEAQYRNFNLIGDLETIFVRTSIKYTLTENNNHVGAGIAFFHFTPYIPGTNEKISVNELRTYQTFITQQNFGRFYLFHRYRFEQRIFKNDFRFRWRYMIRALVGINSKELKKNLFYFAISDEIFIQNVSPTFERNRLYGGFGMFINDIVQIEMGPMWQMFEFGSRPQILISVFINRPSKRE